MSETGRVGFGNSTIEYTVVRSKRRHKTVEITLDPRDGVLVAAPLETPSERVRNVVARRADWIVRTQRERPPEPRPKRFVSGESLPYMGRQARLFVIPADVRVVSVSFRHWSFAATVPAHLAEPERRAALERAVIRWYRQRAAERLPARVRYWASRAGVAPADVLIRAQRERWGSCSPDGTLRFNWRIVMAPPPLIDYVVAHELVHVHFRTHSAAFWAELQRLMPDCQLRRARLREVGPYCAL